MPETHFFILEGLDDKALPSFRTLCGQSPVKEAFEERGIQVIERNTASKEANIVTLAPPIKAGQIVDLLLKKVEEGSPLMVGDYTLDKRQSRLMNTKNDKVIQLTEKETAILCALNEAKGQSVSRQALLEKVWGYNAAVETQTLETHIYRLRQKIEDDSSEPKLLLTLEGGNGLTASSCRIEDRP